MSGDSLVAAVETLSYVMLGYLVLVNAVYLTTGVLAFSHIRHYVQRLETVDLDRLVNGADSLPISLVVPAFNEQASIVDATRSFLSLRYPSFEILIVNDGSSDSTLSALTEAFDLRLTPRTPSSDLKTAEVRAVYRSERHRNLWLIDKANGGKSDALNSGINYCRTPIFCAIDADTLLEPDSLSRAVRPFLEDSRTVATGGIVRVANGSKVKAGLVDEVRLPRSMLTRLQVLEYLRAFLSARMGWDALDATLLISGAFGAFRRSIVAGAGGYATDTVAEDMDLTVRIHRYCRDRGISYRIRFTPDPIAWTECPEDLASLASQRDRWQRGLAEVMVRHRRLFLNRDYGRPALIGYSYYLLFEILGPVVEALAYVTFVLAMVLGVASLAYAVTFFALALVLGIGLSWAAIGLEELSFRRYAARGDFGRLLLLGFVEAFGYRQLQTYWRIKGLWSYLRGHRGWGTIERRGFTVGPTSGG